ncbi:MAG: ELM1/GtrOC1 family putative glycosyltransferase [Hyphomicrobiaceae bacterium]
MRPLSVLLISDNRPGHYHLSEGVVAAISRLRPVKVFRLPVQRRGWIPTRTLAQLMGAGVPAGTMLRAGYGIDPKTLPDADLIVSAGGETLVPNAAIARLKSATNIFCGSLRRLPPEAFSLVVSSYAKHADLPRHIIALKPSGFDPGNLETARIANPSGGQIPPRLAGALIGGNSGLFRYQRADWQDLLHFLQASFAAHGTRWLVSTSRRSPNSVADDLAAVARRPDSPITEFIDFRIAGPGTLTRVFKQAEVILCTEDSSTMISEAVCACLPVVGVAPRHHGFEDKERGYRDYMRDNGWSRSLLLAELTPERFVAELAKVRPLQENHLDRLAGTLRERLPQLFT